MTRAEYEKKLEAYKRSEAPVDIKDKAIAELDMEYYGNSASEKHEAIIRDIKAGQPDYSDIV